ncbi:hypothetical protein Ga0123461_2302 [Mariprofundus aestuarium]|uniref:Uncharacterized protein n=1 Tax=Mariprofundus aestuarium TaxID=1921086 RepID=A0A2K8L0F7_MARES|nr:hypothetical protein Ga0123461_2302 [Mariprofundus aestuarium]
MNREKVVKFKAILGAVGFIGCFLLKPYLDEYSLGGAWGLTITILLWLLIFYLFIRPYFKYIFGFKDY